MNDNKKHSITAPVSGVQRLCGGWAKIEVDAPQIAASCRPGQFVEIKTWGGAEPLLRRPLGVAGASGGSISLLLKAVGKGTALISSVSPGDEMEIIGPLGNGFEKPARNKSVWLVAGGTGIAPFLYMMDAWRDCELRLFYGARSAADCGAVSLLPDGTTLATESGDAGAAGLITEALGAELSDCDRAPDMIFACGPIAMMRHVSGLAAEVGVPCMVSLEAMMGCGFGACLGCAVKGVDKPYHHVCSEGPVFDSARIAWA